jgi:Tn3 transposase DDE domain
METTKRVWQARLDPRRNTPSTGIYSHVRDRWGIFYAPTFRAQRTPSRRSHRGGRAARVDRDVATGGRHSHRFRDGIGPAARIRSVPAPEGSEAATALCATRHGVPPEIAAACVANIDTSLVELHWDALVHLSALVGSGHVRAVAALARFGSAARGDPIHDDRTLARSLELRQSQPSCFAWHTLNPATTRYAPV